MCNHGPTPFTYCYYSFQCYNSFKNYITFKAVKTVILCYMYHSSTAMPHIAIISTTPVFAQAAKSHYVSLYFKKFIEENNYALVEILDLLEYRFPIFPERLKFLPAPAAKTLEFIEKIRAAQGVLIVTPEYNGGYPASLKNIVDYLDDEWNHKPVAIATVSSGNFGGMQVITFFAVFSLETESIDCSRTVSGA